MGNDWQRNADLNNRPALDGFGPRAVRPKVYIASRERRQVARAELIAMERKTVGETAAHRPRPIPEIPKRSPKIDMALPGQESKPREIPTFRKRVRLVRHRAFQTVVVLVVAVIGIGGLLFAQGLLSANRAFKGGSSQATALQEKVDPSQLKGEGSGRINVLLLGIGGKGHDGADLTDTMMVASIDPVNHKTVLVSVPRDLWVTIPRKGSMKINAAYATGKYASLGKIDSSSTDQKAIQNGFDLADTTVEQALGIKIHYNLLVNFQAFKQAVDAVDGITVNVPETLYDPSMAWENNRNPVLAKAGVQQFDGKQALLYVRSRHTSNDFARSQRQRAVILALKDRTANLGTLSNPIKLSGLLSSFGNNVVTDLNLRDASRLYEILKKVPSADVKSVGLGDAQNKLVTTGRAGNQSVVLPLAGSRDFDPIKVFIRQSLPDGFIVKENAGVRVLNGTVQVGRADEQVTELKTYGYRVAEAANAPTKTYTKTVLVDLSGGKNPYTKHYLESRYGVRAVKTLPDSTIQKGTADFILIIGSDETAS